MLPPTRIYVCMYHAGTPSLYKPKPSNDKKEKRYAHKQKESYEQKNQNQNQTDSDYDRMASMAAFKGNTCGDVCHTPLLSHLRNALRQDGGSPPMAT